MKAIRTMLTASLLAFLTLGLASCGGSSASSADGEKTRLRLGAMPSVDYIPFIVAEHLGIYDSLGIDLEIERFHSPMDRDIALQTGKIDGTVSDLTSYMIQQEAGMPVSFGFPTYGLFRLVLRPGLEAKSPGDLVGKKFAISSNTVIDYTTDEIMWGLDYERVEVQKIPLRLEMLASGQVDAAVLPEPFAYRATLQGMTIAPIEVYGDIDLLLVHEGVTKETLSKLNEGYARACVFLEQESNRPVWIPLVAELFGMEPSQVEQIDFGAFFAPADHSRGTWLDVRAWLESRGLIKPQ